MEYHVTKNRLKQVFQTLRIYMYKRSDGIDDDFQQDIHKHNMKYLYYSGFAVIVLLGYFSTETDALTRRSSGGSSRNSSSSSLFSPRKSRRPSGADPNDPRYRKSSNPFQYNSKGSDSNSSSSDDDKKKKKKKKKKSWF